MDNKWNHTYRADSWGPQLYTEEYLNYTKLFEDQVFKDPTVQPMFQMGTLMGSGGDWINQPWNSEVIMGLGINRNGQIKSASQHDVSFFSFPLLCMALADDFRQYHGSNCKSTKQIATLRQNLLNHTNVVTRAYPHIKMAPIVDTYGVEYVLGETNSISCQGRDLVSNVFGSALWYLDYSLFIASKTMVSKMYWHMGTPYRYSLWSPFMAEVNNHSALIRPSYYGALALSEVLGGYGNGDRRRGDGAERQVHAVLEEETLVVYSVYHERKLDSLVIVNMEPWNATQTGTRPYIRFGLPGRIQGRASVKRLTALGSDVKSGETWAGQTVDALGNVKGQVVAERWSTGQTVDVRYAEAAILWFDG